MPKPTYANWCTDGSATKLVAPPQAKRDAGFTTGEKPAFQYINWLFYVLDQAIQALDANQQVAGQVSGANFNTRLLNGGTWSFSAAAGQVTLSAAANLAFPGAPDSANTIASGSYAIADGAVLSVPANVPFQTTANVTSGTTQMTSLGYSQGVAVGQTVTGAGIAAGTTVSSISTANNVTTVTLSQAATASSTGATYSFYFTTALTPVATMETNLAPATNTVILARRVGNLVLVGVGGGQMLLRDQEQKTLLDFGYLSIVTATAGVALTMGQAVYLSPGASDGSRTAGYAYPADTSATYGAVRSMAIGVVAAAAASGASALIVTDGTLNGYSGLTVGQAYYVNPSSPGSLTATRTTVPGQWVTAAGVALSATALDISPVPYSTSYQVQGLYSIDNYGVSNETQLAAALTACASAGGGVIALLAPFTLNAPYTVPPNTVIEGSLQASALTVAGAIGLQMQTGARLKDVWMTCTNNATLAYLSGNYSQLTGCVFVMPSSSTARGVDVYGAACRLAYCTFSGVAGSGTATGIVYEKGPTDSIDDSSVFLP